MDNCTTNVFNEHTEEKGSHLSPEEHRRELQKVRKENQKHTRNVRLAR
jgi:hypothetical protein